MYQGARWAAGGWCQAERVEGNGEVRDLSSVRRAFLFPEMGRTLGGAGFVEESGLLLGYAKFRILSLTTVLPIHCALTVPSIRL